MQTTTNWQRIEAVIKLSGFTANGFARHIGLPRGENLYQIKRGRNGVSLDVANRICEYYPQIDKLWLLTGDGDMFSPDVPDGPWSAIGTSNSETFRGWVAGLVLPQIIAMRSCDIDAIAMAVEYADELQAALAKSK